MRKVFLLSLCFFLLPSLTLAAPVITSVSGTISHDSSVMISGSNFGVKSTAAPSIYDTFEDGVDDTVATVGTWTVVSGRDHVINSNNNRHASSSYNATCNMQGSLGTSGNDCYFSSNSTAGSSKWYVSYWLKLNSNWTWGTALYSNEGANLANIKFIRFWPTGGTPNENVVAAFHTWIGRDNPVFGVEYVDPNYNEYLTDGSTDSLGTFKNSRDIILNTWHHLQFEYKENSGPDTADGTLRWWFNGILIYEKTNLNTCDDNCALKYAFIAGLFDSWDDSSTDRNDAYLDDIYIDSVWDRVEIGNNDVYANCTHREIQIPTVWSGNSIAVTLNQGLFQNGDQTYLYVVDANGQISNGYPITFGGSQQPDPIPPAAPIGVTVN